MKTSLFSLRLFRPFGRLGLIAVVSMAGCTTMKLPDYQPGAVEDYPHRDAKDGLAAAVHAITDESESKTYFGTDLLAADILAVYAIVENRSDGASVVIGQDDFRLGPREAIEGKASQRDGLGSQSGGEAVALVGALLLSPVLLVAGAKMMSDASVIKHNMEVDAFRAQTLSPGETGAGFVYFQLPDDSDAWPDRWFLRLDAMDLKTKDVTSLVFEIDLEIASEIDLKNDLERK